MQGKACSLFRQKYVYGGREGRQTYTLENEMHLFLRKTLKKQRSLVGIKLSYFIDKYSEMNAPRTVKVSETWL